MAMRVRSTSPFVSSAVETREIEMVLDFARTERLLCEGVS